MKLTRSLLVLLATLFLAQAAGAQQIISAYYGAQGRGSDVSRRIQRMVNAGERRISVTNDTMGGDPAPGVPKRLRVTYEVGGRQYSQVVAENSWLTIRGGGGGGGYDGGYGQDAGRLVIVRALYGAHGRRSDVTGIVQSQINSGQRRVFVSNRTLGGDPTPGVPKTLRVTYRMGGREYVQEGPEDSWMAIGRR